jgi:hypothetical protein
MFVSNDKSIAHEIARLALAGENEDNLTTKTRHNEVIHGARGNNRPIDEDRDDQIWGTDGNETIGPATRFTSTFDTPERAHIQHTPGSTLVIGAE